ncbi:hypothetical protein I3760_12G006100 [Carya illinoinensis]|uniref:C2H2-type domain-containing protein n=1 Tax=Carya illinoinensis TaxID=32201 RepID=A0A8T1NS28_CARIL|nr:zinc finger protein ZAT4-like [Carya illinoinensis]KAG2675490.1 hypothetical protein I3760_12G006100 [Carya illinoinensis]KAG6632858.1 hypothetical protein CIPAW_12G007700 [Carya illinoinensis]
MEESRALVHVCKFCSKRFPCGRSLGGHMRSHLTINSVETEEKISRIKFSSFNSRRNQTKYSDMFLEPGTQTGYGLRENPKKNRRLADSGEETSLHDKLLEDQASLTNANQKVVVYSESDNNRRRRLDRKTRYMASSTSSFFSSANPSSSAAEIEEEQEEVAMCLMMLSRDVGHWGCLNSAAESSDNNSVYLEAQGSFQTRRISKTKAMISVCNGSETVEAKKISDKLEPGNLDSKDLKGTQSEFCAYGISKSRSSRSRGENSNDGFLNDDMRKSSRVDDQLRLEDSEVELGKNFSKETASSKAQLASIKYNPSKRKFLTINSLESEICKNSHKRSKVFECTTCNKVFHSYQALGGHRASHKKIKGCFASRVESCENSIETELSPDSTTDSKVVKSCNNNASPIDQEKKAIGCDEKSETGKWSLKNKGHECPICLKVFPSGQALGGHKRSHLDGGSAARHNPTILIQKPVPESRDFLDLNLPAPVEEESNRHVAGFQPWWMGSNQKHEALVGLISN